ncbi:general transcription factor II-I repeat domain-containing protein 2A [Trichonephila clavipes]|nr:general transcription factor II-I repeat domain-containing protein 2A [Trichonephila clavipes]
MDSLIKEFSLRLSQFKELSKTFKFIMYPDVISFDKLNLSQFDWLEIEELEMHLIDFQSSSIWIQKFIETRKKLELIEALRLTSNISKNTSNELLETWNSIPDAFNCLKKLAYAILTIFSSTYACESLFSEINNIKDSLRNRLTDDSNSKKWHVDPKWFTTPDLDVTVDGLPVKALVDSGASSSVVSQKFRRYLKKVMFPSHNHTVLKVANGSYVQPKGMCTFQIGISGRMLSFKFIVLPDCSHDILGWNFLKTSGALIDYGRSELSLDDVEVTSEEIVLNLYACVMKDCRLPAYSIRKIPVLNRCREDSGNVIVECPKL